MFFMFFRRAEERGGSRSNPDYTNWTKPCSEHSAPWGPHRVHPYTMACCPTHWHLGYRQVTKPTTALLTAFALIPAHSQNLNKLFLGYLWLAITPEYQRSFASPKSGLPCIFTTLWYPDCWRRSRCPVYLSWGTLLTERVWTCCSTRVPITARYWWGSAFEYDLMQINTIFTCCHIGRSALCEYWCENCWMVKKKGVKQLTF